MSEQKPEKKRVGAGFGVLILNDKGEVLMGKRHPDPDKADSAFRSAGEWSLPGGKLEWGESFEQGAIREVQEETGLAITNPKVISLHNCKNEHAHFMTVGLMAEGFTGTPNVMEPDEITEWAWFSFEKLPQPRYFPSFLVIENYQKGTFYITGQDTNK
jgi:8-oxo-dGTP diphosphatase